MQVELFTDDLDATVEFWKRFGFEQAWSVDDRAGATYCVMSRNTEALRIRFRQGGLAGHEFFGNVPKGQPGLGVELVVQVTDIDAAWSTWSGTGSVVAPLKLRAWGLKDFRLTDPNGYYVRITEPHGVLAQDYPGRSSGDPA